MRHGKAYHRFKDQVKKERKINIVKKIWWHVDDLLINPRFLGKLVKGKIHCSCPMCASKTNRRHGTYTHGPRISELRRIKYFDDELE